MVVGGGEHSVHLLCHLDRNSQLLPLSLEDGSDFSSQCQTLKPRFNPIRTAKLKILTTSSAGEDAKKLDPSDAAGGNAKW